MYSNNRCTIVFISSGRIELICIYGDHHGWSFLFSWWGGCPTNFGFRHTNFMACHTIFRWILKFSGFEMIMLTPSYAMV